MAAPKSRNMCHPLAQRVFPRQSARFLRDFRRKTQIHQESSSQARTNAPEDRRAFFAN
jgi:hypothetical protein